MSTSPGEDIPVQQERFKSPHCATGEGLVKVKGIWIPQLYLSREPDKFDKIEKFQARPDDIWLSSYPKSGTSWLQQIVYLLVKGENDETTKNLTADERFPYIEGYMPVTESLKDMPSPRLIKTHLTMETLPASVMENKAKLIYIARNVKDVSVSMYHFHKLVANIDYRGTFTDFYKEFLQGQVFYSKWWDHVIGYWNHKDADNVLFIKYEDFHKDSPSEIRQIANFLGIPKTDAEIQRIAELSSFSSMKVDPNVNHSWCEQRGLYKTDHETKFLRKGRVADWKNYYTDEMSQEVDAVCGQTITPVGLEFEYD